MTRETKVGLAVATSFIGLVAVVVATKYHANDPGTQTAQVVNPGETTPVIDKDAKKKEGHHNKNVKKGENNPASQIVQAAVLEPAPFGNSTTEGSPPIFPPSSGGTTMPTPPDPDKHVKQHLTQAARDAEKLPPLDLTPNNASPAPPATQPGDSTLSPPPTPVTPTPGPSTPFASPPASPLEAPPSAVGSKDTAPPSPSLVPKDQASPLPPPDQPKPSVTPTQPTGPSDAGSPPVPGVDPMPSPMTPPGPVTAPPLNVQVPGKISPVPPERIGDNPPPIGPAAGVTPPIASNAPKVKTLGDVVPYITKGGDTSFEAISKQVYADQSGKYAQALLLFNRDYPNADPGLLQNPPVIKAGQTIFIPSIDFLLTRYASAISGANTPSTAGTAPPFLGGPVGPGAGLPSGSAVPPTTPVVPPNTVPPQSPDYSRTGGPASRPVVQPPTSDAFKRYRVPEQGQHILDIAQKTLGDRGRWNEIYRLNPNVPPQFLIPGGTEIRLPANAVVP